MTHSHFEHNAGEALKGMCPHDPHDLSRNLCTAQTAGFDGIGKVLHLQGGHGLHRLLNQLLQGCRINESFRLQSEASENPQKKSGHLFQHT